MSSRRISGGKERTDSDVDYWKTSSLTFIARLVKSTTKALSSSFKDGSMRPVCIAPPGSLVIHSMS
jgi:hypothetical protein